VKNAVSRYFGLIVSSFVVLAGCVGDSPATGVDAGDGSAPCSVGTKSCSGQCVQVNDPKYGCDPVSCTACPADTTKHQAPTCDTNAKCAFSTACDTGFGDCDANPANGCETSTGTDVANCGTCKNTCGTTNTSAVACTAGKCAPTCAAGFSHCSTKDSDGCETNTGATDAQNCGACGHDCLGGVCAAGKCQQLALATGISLPAAIAADSGPSGYVYFSDHSNDSVSPKAIWRASKTPPGNAAALFPNEPGPDCISQHVYASGLTIVGTNLYWSIFAGGCHELVRKGPKGGGSAVWLPATGTGWQGTSAITSDANSLFIATYNDTHNVAAIDLATGTSRDLFFDVNTPNPFSAGLAADSLLTGNVFWTRNDGIFRIAKDGKSARVTVSDYTTAIVVATDDTDAFFTEVGTHKMFKIPGAATCAAPASCAPVLLATGTYDGVSILVDATYVYWSTTNYSAGQVLRIHKDGSDKGTPTVIGTGTFPQQLAQDPTAIYWTDKGASAVYKVAK